VTFVDQQKHKEKKNTKKKKTQRKKNGNWKKNGECTKIPKKLLRKKKESKIGFFETLKSLKKNEMKSLKKKEMKSLKKKENSPIAFHFFLFDLWN
jgi:hypothetical protein